MSETRRRGRPKAVQPHDSPLTCFAPQELAVSVYRVARQRRVSVSAYMRDALKLALEKDAKELSKKIVFRE